MSNPSFINMVYGDKTNVALLWRNTKPDEPFDEQMILLDDIRYWTYLIIYASIDPTDNTRRIIGSSLLHHSSAIDDTYVTDNMATDRTTLLTVDPRSTYGRKVTRNNSKNDGKYSIIFKNVAPFNDWTCESTSNNNDHIPLYIYGIR